MTYINRAIEDILKNRFDTSKSVAITGARQVGKTTMTMNYLGEFNSNDNLQNILIKCSVLNDFYSTNIFKIYPVVKHILSLNVDKRLEANDVTLVDDIAKVTIGDLEKNFYSFASKYCNHHKPLEYPIYDSYVERVLF